LDLKQITYFTWVYEEGSFSSAAKRANVVQPALSMQIKRLEEELGTKLFHRELAGIRPTEAGTRLYGHCVSITRDLALAKEAVIGSNDLSGVSGTVKIGLTPALSGSILIPALLRFLEAYPHVAVSVVEGYTGTVVESVAAGEVDFALGISPPKEVGFMQRTLFRDVVVALCGRPLLGPNYTPVDLERCDDLKLILPSSKHSFASFVRNFIAAGIIKPQNIIEIDGQVAAISLIKSSDWVLLCPFITVGNDWYNDLYVYPVASPQIPFIIHLVYDQRRPLSFSAHRFINVLEEELAIAARRRNVFAETSDRA